MLGKLNDLTKFSFNYINRFSIVCHLLGLFGWGVVSFSDLIFRIIELNSDFDWIIGVNPIAYSIFLMNWP
jgi:hypothetical protein